MSSLSESSVSSSLVVTTLAGLSTSLGGFIVFFLPGGADKWLQRNRWNGRMIALAAGEMKRSGMWSMMRIGSIYVFLSSSVMWLVILGTIRHVVMIAVSLFHVVPESLEILSLQSCLVSILGGVIVFFALQCAIPEELPVRVAHPQFLRTAIVVTVTLILHNAPEGVAVFVSSAHNRNLGLAIAISISLHNIPEGICTASSVYAATESRFQAVFWSTVSGMAEPAAALLFHYFAHDSLDEWGISVVLSVVAGIMISASIGELIPSGIHACGVKDTIIFFVLGSIGSVLISVLLPEESS